MLVRASLATFVAFLFVGVGSASAATVRIVDGRVLYRAAPGELNDIIFRWNAAASQVEIDDRGARVTARRGCFADSTLVYCPAVTSTLSITTGDSDDSVALENVPLAAEINVGPGNDRVRGGIGNDVLDGRSGNDQLDGASGNDTVRGGSGADQLAGDVGDDRLSGGLGDDTLTGGAGADLLEGGSGFDTASYSGRAEAVVVTVGDGVSDGASLEGDDARGTLDAIIGGDGDDQLTAAPKSGSSSRGTLLVGGAGADTLVGSGAADELRGGPEDDTLRGGDGDDLLVGDAGLDVLAAGAGRDLLLAQGGGTDDVRCGPGRDSATFDGRDSDRQCESDSGEPVPGSGGGQPTPRPRPTARIVRQGNRKYVDVRVTWVYQHRVSLVIKVKAKRGRVIKTLSARVTPNRWVRVARVSGQARGATSTIRK